MLQFAKLSGFSTIITTASPHNFPLVQSFGATHTIDRSLQHSDLVAQILSALGNIKPSIVYDAVSEASTQAVAWEVTAAGGLLCVALPSTVDTSKEEEEGEKKRHVHQVYGMVYPPHLRDFGVVLYAQLPKLLAEGKIKVRPELHYQQN